MDTLLLTKVHTLLEFPQYSPNILFLSQSPLGCDISQTSLGFDTLKVLRRTGQVFCPSICLSVCFLMFSQGWSGVMGFRAEDPDRDKNAILLRSHQEYTPSTGLMTNDFTLDPLASIVFFFFFFCCVGSSLRVDFCSCGTGAQQFWLPGSRAQAQQLWPTGLVDLRHLGSSRTRA